MAQDVRPEAADSRRATTLVNLCFAASITSLLMEQPAHLLAVVEAACRRLGTLPMTREVWCKCFKAGVPKHGQGAPAAHDNNKQDANEWQRVRHACHWLRWNNLAAVEGTRNDKGGAVPQDCISAVHRPGIGRPD